MRHEYSLGATVRVLSVHIWPADMHLQTATYEARDRLTAPVRGCVGWGAGPLARWISFGPPTAASRATGARYSVSLPSYSRQASFFLQSRQRFTNCCVQGIVSSYVLTPGGNHIYHLRNINLLKPSGNFTYDQV
jgi:hypothetical protein